MLQILMINFIYSVYNPKELEIQELLKFLIIIFINIAKNISF